MFKNNRKKIKILVKCCEYLNGETGFTAIIAEINIGAVFPDRFLRFPLQISPFRVESLPHRLFSQPVVANRKRASEIHPIHFNVM